MTSKNRIFLDALKRENNQEYVPVWLLRQAGRYLPEYMKIRSQYSDFFQMIKKPEVCKELTLQPLQRYPLDAAITFTDILTIPDAMGVPVEFISGKGPVFGNSIRNDNALNLNPDGALKKLDYVFEATSLIDWEKHLVKIGNKLPIHAGIPGPASIKTLVNYARSCGIGNSLRFITKQAFNLTKLATLSTPDKLIYDLAEHSKINKDSKLEKIHFYAFGGMKKTSEWLNQFNNSDFSYNNKQKFELN